MNTPPRGLRRALAAMVAVVVSSAACAPAGAPAPSGAVTGPPLEKVRVAVLSTLNFADVWIGIEKGFFKDAGLEVETIQFQSGTTMRDSLVAGQIDLSPQGTLTVFVARTQSVPLKAVAARRGRVNFTLVVRSDLRAQVKSFADLKGKTIGVSALGSETSALATYYARKTGLDPERDIKQVVVGTNVYASLKTGRVDAVLARPPDDVRLVQEGAGFLLIDPNDPPQHRQWFAEEDLFQVWIATEELIAKRPQVVKALVQAANRTQAFMLEHAGQPEQLAALLRKAYPDIEDQLLVASVREVVKSIARDASFSRSAYEADLRVYVEAGLTKPIPFAEAVEARFAGERP